MDTKDFKTSTIPLNHEPYGPILIENLVGVNEGKVAVVTGAGRGIGRATSIALSHTGAKIALLDLNVGKMAETEEACVKYPGAEIRSFPCDVTDTELVRSTFKNIESTLGPVDILVNNAGIGGGKLAHEETFEDFWRAVEINFKSAILCIHQVLPSMRARRSGFIVNMASRAATVDMPTGFSYNSSKAALVRAIATLQEELELDGLGTIQTICLHPGAVWGAMIEAAPPEIQKKVESLFKDVPELCANTIAYFTTGKASELRGLYFDCRHDIERVCSFGRKTLIDYGLYSLRMNFPPGYENEP